MTTNEGPPSVPSAQSAAGSPASGDATTLQKEQKQSGKPGSSSRKSVLFVVLLILLLIGGIWGYSAWKFASAHVATDDASLASDIVQITPQVSGSILKIEVTDNQHVTRGQELAALDDTTYRQDLAQAQANLRNAESATRGTEHSVALTKQTVSAQVTQAQGGVELADKSILSAQDDVTRYEAAVMTALAQARNAQAQVDVALAQTRNAQAGLDAANAQYRRAVEAVTGARNAVEMAQAAVKTAQANVVATQATAEKADKDQARYAVLYSQDAISAQALDSATATATTSRAQLESAQRQVDQARATLSQRESDQRSAQEQVHAADAAVRQATAQAASAKGTVSAARETRAGTEYSVRQSEAQLRSARNVVGQQAARRVQALGALDQAQTAPIQIAVQRSNAQTSSTRIDQAHAALQTAQTNLIRTKILAPVDGWVTKRNGQVGQQVAVGQQIMTLIPDNDLWAVANFKETQLERVRPGQEAEVEVDTFPGQKFRGHVDSIAAATGSTTALLPPDNSTGNFTKIVQRVPVKIVFEPNQKGIALLRAGLSITATISTN